MRERKMAKTKLKRHPTRSLKKEVATRMKKNIIIVSKNKNAFWNATNAVAGYMWTENKTESQSIDFYMWLTEGTQYRKFHKFVPLFVTKMWAKKVLKGE